MAAAYGLQLYRDHFFLDENNRTALGSALAFPQANGLSVDDPPTAQCTCHAQHCLRHGKREYGTSGLSPVTLWTHPRRVAAPAPESFCLNGLPFAATASLPRALAGFQ